MAAQSVLDRSAQRHERVVSFIESRKVVKMIDVAKMMGQDVKQASKMLSRMRRLGMVASVGRATMAAWCLPGSEHLGGLMASRKARMEAYGHTAGEKVRQKIVKASSVKFVMPKGAVKWVFDWR